MDLESLGSCTICMESYSDVIRPRSLPCGHSFCGSCLTNSISNGTFVCYNCKSKTIHIAVNGNDFPINYGMEALISEMQKANLGTIPKLQSKCDTRPTKSGDKLNKLLNKEKENLEQLLKKCEEVESDILKYQEYVRQRKGMHENFLTKISDLANRNELMVNEFESEDKKLTEMLKAGREHKKTATDNISRYGHVTDAQEFQNACEDIDQNYQDLVEWRKLGPMQLPNAKAVMQSEKLEKVTAAALQEIGPNSYEPQSGIINLSEMSLSIMEKLYKIKGENPLPLTALKSKSRVVMGLLERGQVYAVQEEEFQIRSAQLKWETGNIYVHALKDGEPPLQSHTIKLSDIWLLNSSELVFLDLSPDSMKRGQGQIHLQVSLQSPLAKICQGCLGPSDFQPTHLKMEYTCLVNGNEKDYELEQRTNGADLFLRNLYSVHSNACVVANTIFIRFWDNRNSKAEIYIGNSIYSKQGMICHVKEGLEYLKTQAKRRITKLYIRNSGRVLPF